MFFYAQALIEILWNVKWCCHPEEVVTLCLTLSPLSALSVCVPFLVYTLILFRAFNPSQSDSQRVIQSLGGIFALSSFCAQLKGDFLWKRWYWLQVVQIDNEDSLLVEVCHCEVNFSWLSALIITADNSKVKKWRRLSLRRMYLVQKSYVKVAEDLKHLCFFLKKLISRQREPSESAPFNLIPITHNIKGFYVQIWRRGSPGGEI